jgi:hypothetical protein
VRGARAIQPGPVKILGGGCWFQCVVQPGVAARGQRPFPERTGASAPLRALEIDAALAAQAAACPWWAQRLVCRGTRDLRPAANVTLKRADASWSGQLAGETATLRSRSVKHGPAALDRGSPRSWK